MGIVFFCRSCGARFEVDERTAGKRGRCKKCGQFMSIPRADEIASMVSMPALAEAHVTEASKSAPIADASSVRSWFADGISKVGLAPITLDQIPLRRIRPSKPSPLDDAEDSKPYLVKNIINENRGPVRAQDNVVLMLWRQQIGGLIKIFRKTNQTAYLISVPFIMILLVGAVIENRSVALFGATVVVLLNIARLVTGIVNVAMVLLRDGIDMKKLKKPLHRVLEPVLTIGLVIVAFTFIPWLSNGNSTKGSMGERLTRGTKSLEGEMRREVNTALDSVKSVDRQKLAGPREPINVNRNQMPNGNSLAPGPESAIRGRIQGVGQYAQDVINDAQPPN